MGVAGRARSVRRFAHHRKADVVLHADPHSLPPVTRDHAAALAVVYQFPVAAAVMRPLPEIDAPARVGPYAEAGDSKLRASPERRPIVLHAHVVLRTVAAFVGPHRLACFQNALKVHVFRRPLPNGREEVRPLDEPFEVVV
jgi:hypothetical protein